MRNESSTIALPARVGLGDGLAVEEDHQRARVAVAPVLLAHVLARGREPGDVAELGLAAVVGAAGEEPATAEHRVLLAQLHDRLREGEHRARFVVELPVHPGQLVVLAVHVVVALLAAADLVAVGDHRHALAEQQRGHQVARLPVPQLPDRRVVGLALDPAVPGAVVALAVVAALAVGVVVLLVVGHQVPHREAVVGGDEVDARDRAAAVVLVEVGRAGDARGELAERGRLAAPEVADDVAVAAVPLGPQRREAADLVTAVAEVPRLGDQLHLGDHRVLLHEVEERAQPVDLVELAGQGGGEVEPEAVDVHVEHPVAQRVHDQLQHVRVPHQQAVAGAGGVVVVLRLVVDQAVVGGVVDAAEAQRGPVVVALGGVVVDDVEDDLDVGGVQRLDHRLELLHLLPAGAVGGVGVVRGEEADRVVAPVVREALLLQVGVLHELVDGHQLDGGDAEALEVLDHRRVADAGVGAADLVRDAGVGLGEALDVRLVDHALVVLVPRQPVVGPVEERVDDDREHRVAQAVLRCSARPGRRTCTRTATGRRRPGRPRPWRTGRAAASRGRSAAPSSARTGRARGSRSAGPAAPTAGTRAGRSRRPR